MKRACVILAVAVFSFAQTTAKKATAPAAKPDTWQKSKECAAQAEKLMTDSRFVPAQASAGYKNHYSLKYNRCFIAVYHFDKDAVKGGPVSSTALLDAFERSTVAYTAIGPKPEVGCRNEAKQEECEELARAVWKIACQIDETPSDCDKANDFITEHMKN